MPTLPEKQPPSQDQSFLEAFPVARRSLIANQFFAAVRGGATTVDDVIRGVKADSLTRMLFANRDAWNTQRQLLALLETEAARAFARQVLVRESLPPEEKLQLKAQRSETYRREYLKARPPTQKQLEFLKALGCFTTPSSRLHASELIERSKR